MTDEDSVAAAAKTIGTQTGLDVLVNNAGIEGRTPDNVVIGPADETSEHIREMFDTNVFGMVRMMHAFLPVLRRSAAPVVVNVSSALSRTADLADPGGYLHFYPGVAYPVSTDLNGGAGTQTVEQGVRVIVAMAQTGPDVPTGGYFEPTAPWPGSRSCRPLRENT